MKTESFQRKNSARNGRKKRKSLSFTCCHISAIRIICLRMKAINPLHSNENPKKFQTQLIEMNRRLYRSLKFITENSLMPDSVSIFFLSHFCYRDFQLHNYIFESKRETINCNEKNKNKFFFITRMLVIRRK